MNIRHIKSIDELRILAGSGIAFVNCSFGKEAKDFLQCQPMNFYNHGIFSNRPSIAIQSMDWREKNSRSIEEFVVAGAPDASATFCISVLSGALEDAKDRKGNRLISEELIKKMSEVISAFEVDSIEEDFVDSIVRESSEYEIVRDVLCFWHLLMTNSIKDALSFYKGVALWRDLLSNPIVRFPLEKKMMQFRN